MANQDTNNWAALANALEKAAEEQVVEVAEGLKADVKQAILDKDIYDTGRLYRSPYVKSAEKNEYAPEDELILPDIPEEADKNTAYVVVGAVYAARHNYGGHGTTARPFWEPSILRGQRRLDAGFIKIENMVREVSG